MADEVYDNTQRNIDEGWFIGINKSRNWNCYWNPFYFWAVPTGSIYLLN